MKTFLCWALVLTGFVYGACEEDEDYRPSVDKRFIAQVAEANQSQIELGLLASTKATSLNVRAFGKKMADDHQAATDELVPIADSRGVLMLSTMNDTHAVLIKRLNKLEGIEFDTAYVNSQIKDHKLTESFFQVEINEGTDAEVKAYANKYLPQIQEHRLEAETLVIVLEP